MGLRQRLRAFWHGRLRPSAQWRLGQRNIYIVPTGAGLAFGGVMLLLLLGSINYQLSLGYALTFLLTGAALVSMHLTHGSLRGLRLHLRPLSPVEAGGSARLEVVVDNPGGDRHGVGFSIEGADGPLPPAWAELPGACQTTVTLAWPCPRRGLHPLPLLRLESRFPFGLFRAWSLWRPDQQAWVYPAAEQPAPPLPLLPTAADTARVGRPGDGEFDGVRPWRRGDRPRQVLWKKLARSGELVSREGQRPGGDPAWLDHRDTHLADPEARLSRLAAWVQQAEAVGRPWGLRLPGRELPVDLGPGHHLEALRALAECPP